MQTARSAKHWNCIKFLFSFPKDVFLFSESYPGCVINFIASPTYLLFSIHSLYFLFYSTDVAVQQNKTVYQNRYVQTTLALLKLPRLCTESPGWNRNLITKVSAEFSRRRTAPNLQRDTNFRAAGIHNEKRMEMTELSNYKLYRTARSSLDVRVTTKEESP